LVTSTDQKVIINGCRIPDGIIVDFESGHIYGTSMGMESYERGIACGVQGGWLCLALRSIFSFLSAIVH